MKNSIKKYREAAGLNRSEAARVAKLSRTHFVAVEDGTKMPTVGVVVRIARALNVSPPYKLYPQLDC